MTLVVSQPWPPRAPGGQGGRRPGELILPRHIEQQIDRPKSADRDKISPGGDLVESRVVLHEDGPAEHFLKSGRAYLVPVYKSTYERGDELTSSMPNESNAYREHVIYWSKDLRRSLDYLETRPDIDSQRLAFFGVSWGGRMAPVVLAVEHRFKAAVVTVAGLRHQKAQPEADPFNYLPRVTLPILLLNGRYDFYFPVETSQRPYFEWLGTPPAHRSWMIYDGSHSVPATQLAK